MNHAQLKEMGEQIADLIAESVERRLKEIESVLGLTTEQKLAAVMEKRLLDGLGS